MGAEKNQTVLESGETNAPIISDDQIQQSGEQLLPLVYKELRRLAGRQMGAERLDHTLQATALVHEAYVRLGDARELKWASRAHFFNAAALAMRRVLIEHARAHRRRMGGKMQKRVPLDILDLVAETDSQTILSLDDAITRFEAVDPGAAAVVRLRFFAGLSTKETAETLEISPRTVKRCWAFARAWLFSAMKA